MDDEPQVSIVIPTHDHQPLLESLVADLRHSTRAIHEIIVVHSGDHTPDLAAKVIHESRPLLASEARNRGADAARGDALFFLDDDNSIAPGSVDVLLDVLMRHPHLGVVGPAMYYGSDPSRPYSFGVRHPGALRKTEWITTRDPDAALVECDAIPNAFMVRKCEFSDVGGFDESAFPMHFEESDLQLRLNAVANKRAAIVTAATVWHHTPVDWASRLIPKSIVRAYLQGRNRSIFIARHCSRNSLWQWILLGLPVEVAVTSIAIIGHGRSAPLAHRMEVLKAFLTGAVQGVREVRPVLLASAQ